MAEPDPPVFAFDSFVLDATQKTLRRDGELVALTPKVFDTLLALIRHSGRLMTKDDLMKEVWPHSFVDDATLAQNISVLRKALGDRIDQASFIETVPKRGYRFVAPVSAASPDPPSLVKPPSRRRWGVAASGLAAVIVGLWWLTLGSGRSSSGAAQPRLTVAVLPFANFGGDASDEYIADGLTEELTAQLAQIEPDRLGVVARTSAMQFKGSRDLVAEIGRKLGVQFVIEGSVRRQASDIRVTVQLIDVSDATHTWAETFDHSMDNLLKMQLDVAESVTHRIQTRLRQPLTAVRLRAVTANPQAFQIYLRANYYWNRRLPDFAAKAIALYQQAVDLDPRFVQAHIEMSRCYLSTASPTARDSYLKAQAAARKALAIDERFADAHHALATASLHLFDWDTATREFKRAETLNPLVRNFDYSVILGQFDDAIAETRRGILVDPANFLIHHGLGINLFYARRYSEAVDHFREALDLNPAHVFSTVRLGQTYGQLGDYDRAIAMLKDTGAAGLGSLAFVYAVSGRTSDAVAIAQQLETQGPAAPALELAVIHAGLGSREAAFRWLNHAFEQLAYQLIYLQVEPRFDALRRDARYDELVRRIGFPRLSMPPQERAGSR